MTRLIGLIAALVTAAPAQQPLPAPSPAFRLGAADFVQNGNGISTVAWRADSEGGLDVTTVPCEGQFVLSFIDRKPAPFNVNSVHTFLQRVELSGHVFESDNLDPLVFRVDRDGYTWVRGKGNVTAPAEAAVQSRGVTVLTDRRTFLLPPGRDNSALTAPSSLGAGQKFSVCGRQFQLASIIRGAGKPEDRETILLRFAKVSTGAEVGKRVSVALADDNGRRFKPIVADTLTWDTLTNEPGLLFDVPKGMTLTWVEVEGIRFNVEAK